MKYIVATDGSTESDEAVQYATEQALAVGAELEIVHVLTPQTELIDGEIVLPGGDTAVEYGERTLESASRVAEEVLERRSDADADLDLDLETALLAGHPAESIADHAESVAADAIYVGHRGLSSEHRQVVGSVAKSVVDKATVPVTIIR